VYKNRRSDIWYADFVFKGRRYVRSLNVTSKSVAREIDQKFKVKVRAGHFDQEEDEKKKDVKFSLVIQDYLEKESINLKSHNRNKTTSNRLLKFFGDKKISAITPDDVTDYRLQRQAEIIEKKNKSKEVINFATVNRELSCLRRVLNWYRKQKRLKYENPASCFEMYREQARERVMTEDEEELFFDSGKPSPEIRDIVIFALATGMRRSEIFRLKKTDVLLGDLGGFIILRDTKIGESRRVPLTKELTDFLKKVINQYPESEYVFNQKNGQPYKDLKEGYNAACKRAGIKNLRFHDLRHTFCTRMANEGVSPFVIMQIVGHKDTKTAKRYTNPTDEHLLAAMAKLVKKSHVFSQTPEKNSSEVCTESINSIAVIGT
jgi:integrase